MKKSDVKKWVKALRSNEYAQSEGYLCSESEISGDSFYCCLGVACDVLVEEYWQKTQHNLWSIGPFEEFPLPPNNNTHVDWGGAETTSFPSPSILEKIGLDVAYAQELAELNDNGWSFKKIANKIEKDLL
ncbi:MAG: hypothetical protein V3U94_02905 [Candidatus Thorarchaeota archaeon]